MEKEPAPLLSNHKLRNTPVRTGVLKALETTGHAMSQPEIEETFGHNVDRITVYRVLKIFEEKGIIHKVYDVNGIAKFALCSSCKEHEHHDEHLHFNCTVCKQLFCLNEFTMPKLNIPAGFQVNQLNISAQGVCKNCAA